MSRARKLKLWNGRWLGSRCIRNQHIYVAAYSVDDVLALLKELGEYTTRGEIRTYWNAGCWGTHMDGIAPERGAWVQTGYEKPVRLIPKEKP